MATQRFDEINVLKRRSLPYEEYFGEMDLTPKQKTARIHLAPILEEIIMIFFDVMETRFEMGMMNESLAKQDLTYQLYDVISEGEYFGNPENEDAERQMNKYIVKIVDDIYNSTVDNMTNHPDDYSYDEEKPYWVSTDRAMFIAENESNTLFNVKEFVEASAKGYTHKIWMAYNDNRVRDTHLQTNGAKIPIGSYFDVGAARMLYPKDVTSEFSTGAEHPEEVVSCRCTILYI